MIRRSTHHHQIERLERLGLWSHKRNLSALRFTHRAIDAFIGIGGYSHQSITVTDGACHLVLGCLEHLALGIDGSEIYCNLLACLRDFQLNGIETIVENMDRGDSFEETFCKMQQIMPQYKEEIATVAQRFNDFVRGEKEGMRTLLTQLKAEGYHLYGLSNWCTKVHETMAQYPIFQLLEGQVISSEEKIIKPDRVIYERICQKYNLKPEECLFADDRIENVEAAEEDGRQHADVGPPDGEDHQGDGQPAAVAEGVVGPHAAGVVHHVVQAAETGDHAAHAGGQVLIPGDVDAGGVGGGGAFAHGAQVQAGAGVLQEIGGQQGQDNGQIRQEAIGQEDLAEPAQTLGKGQGLGKIAAGGGQGDGGDLAAGELDQGAAEEVADAHAEGGHGKAGHVLIGPQRHRQQAVQKSHEQGAKQGAEQGNADSQQSAHSLCGGGLFIEERADDAADAAHIHDAGDSQIQVAGFFGQNFTGAAIEQGNALHNGPGEE